MANGSTDQRLSKLEAKVDTNNDARNQQIAELNEFDAEIAGESRALKEGLNALAARVDYLEKRRTPGFIEYWVPTLSTGVILGSLALFVLGQAMSIRDREDAALKETVVKLEAKVERNEQRGYEISGDIQRLHEQSRILTSELDKMDQYGARRWIKENPRWSVATV